MRGVAEFETNVLPSFILKYICGAVYIFLRKSSFNQALIKEMNHYAFNDALKQVVGCPR